MVFFMDLTNDSVVDVKCDFTGVVRRFTNIVNVRRKRGKEQDGMGSRAEPGHLPTGFF